MTCNAGTHYATSQYGHFTDDSFHNGIVYF
jgi:hypothetical protein